MSTMLRPPADRADEADVTFAPYSPAHDRRREGGPDTSAAVESSEAGGEQIPGFASRLPLGERVLWVGAPDERGVARHVLHARAIAIYFSLLVIVPAVSAPAGRHGEAALRASAWVVPLGVMTVLFLRVLARLIARSTVYALTTRRVAMRVGVALPTYFNIPLDTVESADIRRRGDVADITFTLGGTDRIAYILLWPHARPFFFSRPRPAFRCVRDASTVAALVAGAATRAPESAPTECATAEESAPAESAPAAHASVERTAA